MRTVLLLALLAGCAAPPPAPPPPRTADRPVWHRPAPAPSSPTGSIETDANRELIAADRAVFAGGATADQIARLRTLTAAVRGAVARMRAHHTAADERAARAAVAALREGLAE